MKRVLLILAVALTFAWTAMAQDQAASGSSQTTTSTTTTKKSHKKAASSDASASDSEKAESAKKSEKSSTVTGCVSKEKDAAGNYTLTNGRYKNGVDVTGNDDLSAHAGHKVQLTGTWTTAGKSFQESKIKHIADTCTAVGSKSVSADTTTTKTTKKSKKSTADASAPPKA